jgi:hypothetical protein
MVAGRDTLDTIHVRPVSAGSLSLCKLHDRSGIYPVVTFNVQSSHACLMHLSPALLMFTGSQVVVNVASIQRHHTATTSTPQRAGAA